MQATESGISGRIKKLKMAQAIGVELFAAVLFLVLPLAMKNQYSGIGTFKYEVFRTAAAVFLPVLFLLYGAQLWLEHRQGIRQAVKKPHSLLDRFVFCYLIMTMVSCLGAQDKYAALFGAEGWNMGLLSQLAFVGIYFVVSRCWSGKYTVWYLACVGAFFVFTCGVLHRFSIDPIGVYEGLTQDQKLRFLSTLGQATWYSSYVCTVFPLGLYLFFKSDRVLVRLATGTFAAMGFATIVTQNSDSAFIALFLVILCLFYMAFDSPKDMGRFLEVLLLLLFSFEAIGLLQRVFSARAMRLDTLSEFASQSLVTGVSLITVCILYAWYSTRGFRFLERAGRYEIRRAGMLLVILAAAGSILMIACNTAGLLDGWLGESILRKAEGSGGYWYFDDQWGNGRGRTWKFAVQAFGELPFWRKLIGVGPDCFASYYYAIPRYSQQLYLMWGADALTNVHNEWMNAILCYGLLGGAAYIGMFFTAFRQFFLQRKIHPQTTAAALCIAAYIGHNLFCYQQVLCTPYVFWIMGMGEAVIRKNKIEPDHGITG